jgi:hypothetical protein
MLQPQVPRLARKHIVALGVKDAGVDMHAVAGPLQKRFGHESGAQPVLVSRFGDQPAQQHGVVGGRHCIGAVLEIDLELSRCRFLDDGVDRQSLGHAAERISANSSLWPRSSDSEYICCWSGPGPLILAHAARALEHGRIDQVKLKLERGDRRETLGSKRSTTRCSTLRGSISQGSPVSVYIDISTCADGRGDHGARLMRPGIARQ